MNIAPVMQPEERARILSEVIRQSAQISGPFKFDAIHSQVMKAVGLPEEECGQEIMAAVGVLIRQGILECNTYDEVAGTIMFRSEMRLTVGKCLTSYIWADQVYYTASDDDDEGAI